MPCFRTTETARVAGPAPRTRSQCINQLPRTLRKMAAFGTISVAAVLVSACGSSGSMQDNTAANAAAANAVLVAQGKQIFRFDTFGDESKWTDVLGLHTTITAAVTPTVALSVGLKVDFDALDPATQAAVKNGTADLTSTATTIELLRQNAVVGLMGTVDTIASPHTLTHVGVTCALCHSTVDNSVAPGIGTRLDGWPNLQLNPGAIIALSPALTAAQKAVFNSWGPGKYDPRFNEDSINGPQVIPPAYGLAGINSITVTGDGTDIAYWNRYVGVTQMGGHGTFQDPRVIVKGVLGAAFTNPADANGAADLITAKLPALQAYQLSLNAPPPPAGSFDAVAAARGQIVFNGAGKCSTCHSGSLFTDAPTLHLPSDVVSEPEPAPVGFSVPTSYALRSGTKMYRTSPLHGLWQHAPYFHNGSAATLADVVSTYNTKKTLGLSTAQMADLTEYLKSL